LNIDHKVGINVANIFIYNGIEKFKVKMIAIKFRKYFKLV